MTEQESRHRAVGRIVRPHGVRGEVVVDVRTDSPEERFADGTVLRAVFRGGEARELTILATRPHSGRLLTTFAGIRDRTDAEPLAGTVLTVDVSTLPPSADPEEYHDHQLEGLAVRALDGAELGTVREVLHLPAGELLAVRLTDGREALVPFVHSIVPEVDLAAGELRIDPPDGLLDEE